jgi:hypothetical protein
MYRPLNSDSLSFCVEHQDRVFTSAECEVLQMTVTRPTKQIRSALGDCAYYETG